MIYTFINRYLLRESLLFCQCENDTSLKCAVYSILSNLY